MVLLEDTRNQPGKHKNIEAFCREHGIEIVRQALNVGDYMLCGPEYGGIKGDVCCDTKTGVLEIASNCFQEHRRFREECIRAQKYGIQLIVLIEEALPGGRLENWRPPLGRDGLPRARFDPAVLKKTMITMQERYGVKFRFCDGRSTGKQLIEYLEGKRK